MIWGYDQQHKDAKFCIVVEGLLDAMAIGALAICSNEINDSQAQVIETLDRDIIVVPDRDKAGQAMVNAALNYGWGVAFPEWETGIKDTADAVAKYGNLFTMRSILNSVQTNKLKIQLVSKKWF
jgi:DNA primase